jgi:hypothetical protein
VPLLAQSRVRRAVGRLAALTGLALLAGTGTALAACPTQPVSTPFAQWGDTNSYFLVPGGSFEGSGQTVGWTLSGASLTAGNEPFYVDSPADNQSLTINGGGSATSPFFCVDDTMTDLRLFADQTVPGSDLQVSALVQTPSGVITVPVADLADGSMPAWGPTAALGADRSGLEAGDSVMVALQFSAPGTGGSWSIDDVYIDPYRSG